MFSTATESKLAEIRKLSLEELHDEVLRLEAELSAVTDPEQEPDAKYTAFELPKLEERLTLLRIVFDERTTPHHRLNQRGNNAPAQDQRLRARNS